MAEFISNPRRAPRAPARCRTAVVSASASFEAETEDIGARGCQVVSPKGVRKGAPVRITIANDKLPDALRVGGRIAWVSAHFPWRVGIAFDESALPKTTWWFARLVAAHPGMRTLRRLPERIPASAVVYLGPPPRFLVDFSADEAALLRAIGSGAAVYELMARFRVRGEVMERALFSLLARSAVTLVRGQAVHPLTWKRILDQVEASLAVASLGEGPASLAASPERPTATSVPAATPVPAAAPVPAPDPVPWAAPSGSAPVVPPAPLQPRSRTGTPIPDAFRPVSPRLGTPAQDSSPQFLSGRVPPREVADVAARGGGRMVETGVRWGLGTPAQAPRDAGARPAATPPPIRAARNPEAQVLFDRAHEECRAGNLGGAAALLRRALVLAPGDAEISGVLGKIAFGGRDPGAR